MKYSFDSIVYVHTTAYGLRGGVIRTFGIYRSLHPFGVTLSPVTLVSHVAVVIAILHKNGHGGAVVLVLPEVFVLLDVDGDGGDRAGFAGVLGGALGV